MRPVDKVRQTSLTLPPALTGRLRTRARDAGTSQVNVILDAVVAHRHDLVELVHEAEPVPEKDELFTQSPQRTESEPHAVVSIRMNQQNLDVLDQLVKDAGARSRSHLVATALTEFLRTAGA